MTSQTTNHHQSSISWSHTKSIQPYLRPTMFCANVSLVISHQLQSHLKLMAWPPKLVARWPQFPTPWHGYVKIYWSTANVAHFAHLRSSQSLQLPQLPAFTISNLGFNSQNELITALIWYTHIKKSINIIYNLTTHPPKKSFQPFHPRLFLLPRRRGSF